MSSSGNEEYRLVSRKMAHETSVESRRSGNESRQPADDDRQRKKSDDWGNGKKNISGEVDDCNMDQESFLRKSNRISDDFGLNQIHPETNGRKEMLSNGMNRLSSDSDDNGREDRQICHDLEVTEPIFESNESCLPDDKSRFGMIEGLHSKNGDIWHCNHSSSNIFVANEEFADDKVSAVSFVSSKDQMPQMSSANYHQCASDVSSATSVTASGQLRATLGQLKTSSIKRRRFARINPHPLSKKIYERALRGTSVPVEEFCLVADTGSCDEVRGTSTSVSKLVKYFENLSSLGRKSPGAKKSGKYQDHQCSFVNPCAVFKDEMDCVNSIDSKESNYQFPFTPTNLEGSYSTEKPRLVIEVPHAGNLNRMETLVPGNEYFEQNVAAIFDGFDAVSMPFVFDPQQDGGCENRSQQIQKTDLGTSALHTSPDSHGDYPGIFSEQTGIIRPDNLDANSLLTIPKNLQNPDILQGNTSHKSLKTLDKTSEQSNRITLDNPNMFSELMGPKMSDNPDNFSKQEGLWISSNLVNVLEKKRLETSDDLKNFPKQEGLKMPGTCSPLTEAISEMVNDDSNIPDESGLFWHLELENKNSAKKGNVRPTVDKNIERTRCIESQKFYNSVPEKRLVKLPASKKSNVIATVPTEKDGCLPKSKESGCVRMIILYAVGIFVFLVVWSFLFDMYRLN